MPRIQALNPETTTGKSKDLFNGINAKLGMVPNMMRTMGHSPAVLSAYLNFSESLSSASLGTELTELISLAVANVNGCDYCNSAHSFISEKMVGISADAINKARDAESDDSSVQVVLSFAVKLVRTNGQVSEEDVLSLKYAGYSDAAITEIIAYVALNIFTNYFNNVVDVDIDFPKVKLSEAAGF